MLSRLREPSDAPPGVREDVVVAVSVFVSYVDKEAHAVGPLLYPAVFGKTRVRDWTDGVYRRRLHRARAIRGTDG